MNFLICVDFKIKYSLLIQILIILLVKETCFLELNSTNAVDYQYELIFNSNDTINGFNASSLPVQYQNKTDQISKEEKIDLKTDEKLEETTSVNITDNMPENETSTILPKLYINKDAQYVFLPIVLIFFTLAIFVFILISKFSFLCFNRFCPCTKNDSICLFMNFNFNEQHSDVEQNSSRGMFTANDDYSTVIKHKLLPVVSDLPRVNNGDMNYYGVVNDDSDDSLIGKNVTHRSFNKKKKNDKAKRINSYSLANNTKNNSNLESFRMESFNKEATNKKNQQKKTNDETNENFYLDIYNSFANLNNPLSEMLYVEDDPLNEFDQIEKNISKSVCELNMLHKNVDNKVIANDELYYQDLKNNDDEKAIGNQESEDIKNNEITCKVY